VNKRSVSINLMQALPLLAHLLEIHLDLLPLFDGTQKP
jgi:hypothetical protein